MLQLASVEPDAAALLTAIQLFLVDRYKYEPMSALGAKAAGMDMSFFGQLVGDFIQQLTIMIIQLAMRVVTKSSRGV